MNEISKKGSRAEAAEVSQPRGITVAMRHGRGRAGGSTFLDLIIQLARAEGRSVLIGDGDRRNPTLAGLYPPGQPGGATQPPSDDTPDVKQWLTDSIEEALNLQSSIVIDLGGGDRVMQEYGHDLALVDFCEAAGVHPLGLFVSGPELDDFEHVLAIWRAGYFRPRRSLLIFNEHLVTQGKTPHGAFGRIAEQPGFAEMIEGGMRPVVFPEAPVHGGDACRWPRLRRCCIWQGRHCWQAARPGAPVHGQAVDREGSRKIQRSGAMEWLP